MIVMKLYVKSSSELGRAGKLARFLREMCMPMLERLEMEPPEKRLLRMSESLDNRVREQCAGDCVSILSTEDGYSRSWAATALLKAVSARTDISGHVPELLSSLGEGRHGGMVRHMVAQCICEHVNNSRSGKAANAVASELDRIYPSKPEGWRNLAAPNIAKISSAIDRMEIHVVCETIAGVRGDYSGIPGALGGMASALAKDHPAQVKDLITTILCEYVRQNGQPAAGLVRDALMEAYAPGTGWRVHTGRDYLTRLIASMGAAGVQVEMDGPLGAAKGENRVSGGRAE
jgi:hypothetical protein